MPASQLDAIEAQCFVIAELNCHRQDYRHTWIDTLNRLIRKSGGLFNANGDAIDCKDLPILNPAMLKVRRELWPLSRLISARHCKPHDRDAPKCDQCPILVLSILGKYFLVDGGTRTNRRIRDKDDGPHAVVVIEYVPQ